MKCFYLILFYVLACITFNSCESCVFPSHGLEGTINECRYTPFNDRWWCPAHKDFYTNFEDIDCPSTDTTVGGNDPGHQCYFPAIVNGKARKSCLEASKAPHPLRVQYMKVVTGWCSTTPDFDRDRKWTYCQSKASPSLSGNLIWIVLLIVIVVIVLVFVIFIICKHIGINSTYRSKEEKSTTDAEVGASKSKVSKVEDTNSTERTPVDSGNESKATSSLGDQENEETDAQPSLNVTKN